MIDDSYLDDFGISPRILEHRRTGVVHPLERGGLDHLVETAPIDLAVMGAEVTPDAIVQRVRAEVKRGVARGIYKHPSDNDFGMALSEERLETLCYAFETRYRNGADFRERMSKSDARKLLRSYGSNMLSG